MPEYLYPGVYVEEIDTGNKPIEGVSTSTAGFLGIAERGPIAPTLLTSFGDYQRSFGSYVNDPDGTDHYLAYAVEGIFQNGGLLCFVQRVVHVDTVTPANSAKVAWSAAGGMRINAIGPGIWGNNVAYQISNAGLADPNLFKLTSLYWAGTPPADLVSNPTAIEIFDNLSPTPSASTFYESEINGLSNLAVVKQTAAGRPANNAGTLLTRGSDGINPNLLVSAIAGLTGVTSLTDAGTLILTSGAATHTFTVNAAAGPIKTVTDLLTAINADGVVGAKASLDAVGHLNIQDPTLRGNLTVTGTLAVTGANLGTFSPASGPNLNLLVGTTAGLAGGTVLTDTRTLILTSGAATVTFTVQAVAGPIKTVTDLMAAVNADAVVGAKAVLDAAGHLNIQDPASRGNLAATGSLAVAGADLGTFAPAGGPNLNLLVGTAAGLTGVTSLTDTGTLMLTSGAATHTFTVNAAAGPIKTVADLMTAINADAVVGAKAALDAAGHLNIQDLKLRGNLAVAGTLAVAGGNVGALSVAGAKPTPADFEGNDIDPANKTGLLALGDVDEISLLCCPDEFYLGANDFTIAGLLRDQCELLKYRFAILQAPLSAGTPANNNPSVNSKYAAYYFPWLNITNPNTGVPVLVPAGGHIAGIYARSDNNIGVQKDPANEVINGIAQLQLQTNDQQQAILNPKGVNCLRYFKGAGNLVWGGRTTTSDPDWKYINVRRIFIFVEKSIQRGTQWVVFEINAEPTWARVRRSISDFLTGLWRDGVLQGAKKEQAFFVKCDNTTMSQADIDNGRLICVIGIAPVKPAEFVIFRIGQWYGGSEVSEQ